MDGQDQPEDEVVSHPHVQETEGEKSGGAFRRAFGRATKSRTFGSNFGSNSTGRSKI
uniref:Uncharacterized protein n=1 Tax=Physcomitrium patens TaxID=3218 RepID=A0A2K1JT32_PHYPA|nr:hypothetical protein PHYPA_014459 [Physcomitrium patens]